MNTYYLGRVFYSLHFLKIISGLVNSRYRLPVGQLAPDHPASTWLRKHSNLGLTAYPIVCLPGITADGNTLSHVNFWLTLAKLNIIKTKITAPSPITSRQMGGKWKQWQNLFLGGSKVTADGDCSHEIKRHLLLEWKAMTNLDSELKSRDILLSTKVCIVKAVVFWVVM